MLPRFDYVKPDSIEAACELLRLHDGRARPLAGGTDLLCEMRRGENRPEFLIDLKGIAGLDTIRVDDDGAVAIGALTRTRDIERSSYLREGYTALAEAVDVLASVQIRNRARLGGNLCHASPGADTPPALMALGAQAVIAGPEGRRQMPLDAFFTGPGKTDLGPGEILIEIRLPSRPARSGSAYERMTVRRAMDLAVVGCGASIGLAPDGRCAEAGLALGAVAPTPTRASAAEARLRGERIDAAAIAEAAALALEACAPISDARASAGYRRRMVQVYAERTLTRAWQRATLRRDATA